MDSRRGEAGHADGFNSYVSGFAAHTDGVSNVADGHISKASGRSNRAWSYLSKVDGYQSVVKPDDTDTNATGEGSWANGKDIQIVGAKYAYAGGENGRTTKKADYSFSHGLGLITQLKRQSVFGSYNAPNNQSLFMVGYGDSNDNRKNAIEVLYNGTILLDKSPSDPLSPIRLKDFTDNYIKNSKAETAQLALKANDFTPEGSIKANFDSHSTRIVNLESQTDKLNKWRDSLKSDVRIESFNLEW